MLPRRALQVGAVLVVIVAVLSILSATKVGLPDPPPESDAIETRIVDNFETAEDEYLLWGRWIDLTSALAFASFLVAASVLPGLGRSRPILVAGAAVATVGEVVDLSKLFGFDVGRLGLENDLPADFAAGNVFRFAIGNTSTFIWLAGLVLLSVGLIVLASDTPDRSWRSASAILAATLALVVASVLWTTSLVVLVATLLLTIATVYWMLVTIRRLNHSPGERRPGSRTRS
jgi:hypothetical protein